MTVGYSVDDLVEFLAYASAKGLIPAATASAFGVATRTVLGALDGPARQDLRKLELEGVMARFTSQRAEDFSASSLKEYGRRVRRAVELFLSWRRDPANFTVRTRATATARRRGRDGQPETISREAARVDASISAARDEGGYQSAFPIRPGTVVTVLNIPFDFTPAEAERLAKFVKMLAVE